MSSLAPLLRAIRDALDDGEPVVVALDGFSAAGKSTLAIRLADELTAAIVPMDDFYRDMDDSERWDCSPEEAVACYFDWRRLRREALEPLSVGRRASYRPFDWAAGRGLGAEIRTIEPAPVVVVEGVYSSRPEFADLLDLSVFVDTPVVDRAARRRSRHDHGGVEARWDAAEEFYFTHLRPPESFDLIVVGHAGARVAPRQS